MWTFICVIVVTCVFKVVRATVMPDIYNVGVR